MPLPIEIELALKTHTYRRSNITIIDWQLNDEDIVKLVNYIAENETKITSLILSRNIITSKGAQLIASITWLNKVNLSQNHIADEGAIALANNTSLKEIDLSNNNLTDTGANALISSNCPLFNIEGNSKISPTLAAMKNHILKAEEGIIKGGSSYVLSLEEERAISRIYRTADRAGLETFSEDATRITPKLSNKMS